MVWAATSVVAGDVTDRPAPVVAHREVVQALAATPSTTSTTPAVTAPTSPRPTVPQRPTQAVPVEGPSQPQGPGPGTTLPSPTTTTVPTTASTAPPPTTAPPIDPTATFSTAGGVVTATCSGYFIRLVSATPTDGYAVQVLDRGPATVDVHFTGSGDEVRVRLVCFGGRPTRIPDQHEARGASPGPP